MKMVNLERTRNEIKSITKKVIDEFYEEIINEIQEELTIIEQVKKQITWMRKRFKLPDLSHLTWSQLNELEFSYEQSLHYKQHKTLEHEIEPFKDDGHDNNVEIDFSKKLISYAKKGTEDGTGFNIFSTKLLSMLDINVKNPFDEFVHSLKAAIKEDMLPNKVLNEVSESYFLKLLSNFRNNSVLTTNEKEHLSELIIFLASSAEMSSDLEHPSLAKISEYLDTNNLACGLNHVSIGSGQGYDLLIITVEEGTGFKKLSRYNPIELKWRTSNTRDWLQPCNIKRQMSSSFRQSIEKIYSIDGLPVGACKISKNGELEFIADTGFSMYTTFGRGNDGITKLNQFNDQLNMLAKSWEKSNKGQIFPLHEIVPDSSGKTLQESLIDAVREQCFFEGLMENGFILDYTGDLNNYKHVIYLPKRSYTFKFNCHSGTISRTIYDRDFRIFEDDNPVFMEPSNVYSPEFPNETIVVDRYYSFILSEDTNFMVSLGLEPEYYRIFITDFDIPESIILSDDNGIVCTEEYYFKHKQDLIVEIKTRFANDIRNGKKLAKWNEIVTEDFVYETDLAFFTANP